MLVSLNQYQSRHHKQLTLLPTGIGVLGLESANSWLAMKITHSSGFKLCDFSSSFINHPLEEFQLVT